MASDINNVVLVGNLTRDAELKYISSGSVLCNFSIAVNEEFSVDGKKQKKTSFIECVLWGKAAEGLSPYLAKGLKIAVTGKLSQSRWEQDGKARSKINVSVDQIQFLTPKGATSDKKQYNSAGDSQEVPF